MRDLSCNGGFPPILGIFSELDRELVILGFWCRILGILIKLWRIVAMVMEFHIILGFFLKFNFEFDTLGFWMMVSWGFLCLGLGLSVLCQFSYL